MLENARDPSGSASGPDGHVDLSARLLRETAERERLEAELKRSEELKERLLEGSPDCVKLLALDGTLEMMSEGGMCLMEVDDFSIIKGAYWPGVWPEESRSHALAAVENALAGRTARFQGFCPTAKGTPKWWDVMVSPVLDSSGKPEKMLSVSRDITEIKQMSDRLQQAQEDLLRVSRLSAMGAMASTLAHELNQPLTAAANYLAAAGKAASTGNGGLLDQIVSETKAEVLKAGEIIRRMRSFTIDGKITPKPEDLGASVDAAVALELSLPEAQGVTVVRELRHEGALVMADRVQIEQVLTNVIRNAVQAMAGCRERKVVLTTRKLTDLVELRIRDTGPGLSAAARHRLFEPFATTKDRGTGLGLPICRTIVEAHGGRIRAEPSVVAGAEFVITLPVARKR